MNLILGLAIFHIKFFSVGCYTGRTQSRLWMTVRDPETLTTPEKNSTTSVTFPASQLKLIYCHTINNFHGFRELTSEALAAEPSMCPSIESISTPCRIMIKHMERECTNMSAKKNSIYFRLLLMNYSVCLNKSVYNWKLKKECRVWDSPARRTSQFASLHSVNEYRVWDSPARRTAQFRKFTQRE